MMYERTGPFQAGGAPGIDHTFLNAVEVALLELEATRMAHVERDDKDDDGLWRTVRYRRPDGTLLMESVLGPEGEGPEYPERTVTWYEADGETELSSVTYALSYDDDDELTGEVPS